MRRVAAVLLALCLPGAAWSECRLALALGLDVSGSVDRVEYRQQLDGVAAALMRPEVRDALLAMPGAPVRIYVYEWSGADDQRVLQDWTGLVDAATIAGVAARLSSVTRVEMELTTGLGEAMLFGQRATASQADCWRRTLDISGDGESNSGPRPREVRDALGDLTINALVIGDDRPQETRGTTGNIKALRAYFETEVIRGANAFTEVANGYKAYEDAMARKLLREVQVIAIGRAGPSDQ